jgi:hypothetical protein
MPAVFLNGCIRLVGTVVIIAIISPYAIVTFVPLLLLFYFLQVGSRALCSSTSHAAAAATTTTTTTTTTTSTKPPIHCTSPKGTCYLAMCRGMPLIPSLLTSTEPS